MRSRSILLLGVVLVSAAMFGFGCAGRGEPKRTEVRAEDAAVPVDAVVAPDAAFWPTYDADSCGNGREDIDHDGDGFTPAHGDCDDCSPQVNPDSFDDPLNDVDEDCSGTAATEPEDCSAGLVMDSADAEDAARTMGLCRFLDARDRGWGVISARWTRADGEGTPGSQRQHGIVDDFGSLAPTQGASMLVLSSGAARAPDHAGYTSDCDTYSTSPRGELPEGLDPNTPACPGVETGDVYDPVALELKLRVPANAHGLQFNSNFFTYEYPNYVCSPFNDFYVVLMDPKPGGSPDGNLVFDVDGNRVSVNNSLLRACEAGRHSGRDFACPLGTGPLADTGFDGDASCGSYFSDRVTGAATGWLQTQVPVEGGSVVTLRFAIWDSGDPNLDSLVLVDGFTWLVEEPETLATEPILE